jgi:hypothetical protein
MLSMSDSRLAVLMVPCMNRFFRGMISSRSWDEDRPRRIALYWRLTRKRSAAPGESARRCGLKDFSHVKAEQYVGPAAAASIG